MVQKIGGWNAPVLLMKFIRAAHQHRSGCQMVVIGENHASFACIDLFVSLKGKTASDAEGTEKAAVPARPQGVSAVFDEQDVVFAAEACDFFHVSEMTSHVGKKEGFRAMGLDLRGKVIKVNDEVLCDLHQFN